jgi:repressor LexA
MRPRNDDTKALIYEFVNKYIKENGVSPSTQEISNEIGIAKSSVSKYMNRLVDEGWLQRFGRNQVITKQNHFAPYQMPVIGAVACGKPKLAIEDIQCYIPLDRSLKDGEYFGLIADGESMRDVGIHTGDIIFVRRQDTADDGDIVVAMIDDEYSFESTATLKRFFRDKESKKYILRPENSEMDDIIVDRVRILGKAVRIYKNIEDNPI